MKANLLHFPTPAERLCAGLPREAVIVEGSPAAAWDPEFEVEVVHFFVPRWDGVDGVDPLHVTVALDPVRERAMAALVTRQAPSGDDIERLLGWLGVPDSVLLSLQEQDWPGMAAPSTVVECAKRWGVGCGCAVCGSEEVSVLACEVAQAALAYVVMHGGPSVAVNRAMVDALPQWVAFFRAQVCA